MNQSDTGESKVRSGLAGASRYVIALYGVRLLALVKSALLAALLGPSSFGVLSAVATVLAYTAFLDVGLFHAMNREVPMLRGSNDSAEAVRVIRASRSGSLATGFTAAAIMAGCSALQAYGILDGNWWLSALLSLAVAMQTLAGMLHALCYAEMRFDLQARALTVATFVDLAFSMAGAYLFGVAGALSGFVLAPLVQWVVLRRGFGPIALLWDFPLMWRLIGIGVPIGLVWLANTNLVGLDKLVILFGLGPEPLGLYSIAAVAGTLVTIGPNAVSQMITPRVLEKAGRQENSGSLNLVRRSQEVSGMVGGTVAAIGIAVVPVAIAVMLPAYRAAVPSAQVLMIASAVFGLVHPLVGYFVAQMRQLEVAAWYLSFGFANVLVDVVLLRAGMGLVGVASGSLLTYLALYASLQLRTRMLGREPGTRQLVRPILLMATPIVIGLAGWSLSFALSAPVAVGAAVALICALAGAATTGVWVARRYELLPGRMD